TSCSACGPGAKWGLPIDGKGHADDRVDVLLAARRVVDAVVADVGGVARRHLIDALRAAAHPAELAAKAVDEDLRAPPRLLGRLLQRVQLRLLQFGRDVRKRAGRDVDAALQQTAYSGGDGLDDVDLARAHLELLRDAIARTPSVMRELDHD